jgi:hypothetical protein
VRRSQLIPDSVRENSRNLKPDAVKYRLRAEVQSLTVVVTPGKVMCMFRAGNCVKVSAFWGKNPDSARSRNIQISFLVYFHSVEGILTLRCSHVEEDRSAGQRAVFIDVVSQEDTAPFAKTASTSRLSKNATVGERPASFDSDDAAVSEFAPAIASFSSSSAVPAPVTPTSPTISPSTTIGMPPIRGVKPLEVSDGREKTMRHCGK